MGRFNDNDDSADNYYYYLFTHVLSLTASGQSQNEYKQRLYNKHKWESL
jgi:hypothetical protein